MAYRDARCKRCGKEFRTSKSEDHCESCSEELEEEEKARQEREAEEARKAEIAEERLAKELNPPAKQIKADSNRNPKIKRAPIDTSEAQNRLSRSQAEPVEARKEKDPLRQRLVELRAREAELKVQLEEVKQQIEQVHLELQKEGSAGLQKKCFGRWDKNDWECIKLCPLMVECESVTVGRVTAPPAEVDA